MLNIGKLAGVDGVDYYLSQVASGIEDYYLGKGEAPGQWTGSAAPHLGLQDQVDAESLRRVLGGYDASGKPLTGLRSTRKIPGFDLAFRVPKSVSLLWALGGPDVAVQAREAHNAAVAAALAYLEERRHRRPRAGHPRVLAAATGDRTAARRARRDFTRRRRDRRPRHPQAQG